MASESVSEQKLRVRALMYRLSCICRPPNTRALPSHHALWLQRPGPSLAAETCTDRAWHPAGAERGPTPRLAADGRAPESSCTGTCSPFEPGVFQLVSDVEWSGVPSTHRCVPHGHLPSAWHAHDCEPCFEIESSRVSHFRICHSGEGPGSCLCN